MPTTGDIASQMRAALQVTEPDLDTTVGTTVRKIIDVVAESIAEVYADRYLLNYQYDIDVKQGPDLTDFVTLFGFSRYPAKRAAGSVTFERLTPATNTILIPIGTQLANVGSNPVTFVTMVPAIISIGQTAITIPVRAVEAGTTGNVSAGTVTRLLQPLEGVNSVSNTLAISGGADQESDDHLRDRFKKTVFRHFAGTEPMFLGVAQDDPDVSLANVVGSSKRYREQVQIVGGTAQSVIQDAKYIFPDSYAMGTALDLGEVLTPGIHYQFDETTLDGSRLAPTVNSLDGTVVPDGVYDLEFEYVPKASRNDPTNGITNRVDVYVNGVRSVEAAETVIFRTAKVFTDTTTDPLYRQNFRRLDGTAPVAGNYFIRFTFGPITDPTIDDQFTIGPRTFVEGTDYWLVNDITAAGGTATSFSGIEFKSVANGSSATDYPADGAAFPVTYLYNEIPAAIERALRAWRLVTQDVRVHQAQPIRLNLHFDVIYEPGFTSATVNDDIVAAVNTYFDRVGFNGVVQVSDLLNIAHQVAGVDAIRFLTSADHATLYAIQEVAADGTTILQTYDNGGTPKRAVDVLTGDAEVPLLNAVFLTTKAQNTFGTT